MPEPSELSRRERQIMDAVFSLGEATVNRVVETIPSPPTAMAVRRMMHILEEKGHLKHVRKGIRYIYSPTHSRRAASRSALKRVLHTFYDGSIEEAAMALFEISDTNISDREYAQLRKMITKFKKRE